MIPISIEATAFLLPEGTRAVTYHGPAGSDVLPLDTLVLPDGRVVSQWVLDPNEIALLSQGVPVTLILHSGGAVPPIQLAVGGCDLR